MRQVRQLWLTERGQFEVLDASVADDRWDQVVIRPTQVAVCTSDLDKFQGRGLSKPDAVGHECAGVVVKVSDQASAEFDLAVDDHVVFWTPAGGGFASEYVADVRHVIKASAELPFPALAEPLGCVVNSVAYADIGLTDTVVVLGATGAMGLMTTHLSRLSGAELVVGTGRRAGGLQLARAFGAGLDVNTATDDLQAVMAELEIDGADVVFECTGSVAGLTMAADVARVSGRLALVAFYQGEPQPVELETWGAKGLEVVNCHFRGADRCVPAMRDAVRLMESGRIEADLLLTHEVAIDERFPVGDVRDAFELAIGRPEGFVKLAFDLR